MFQVTVPLGLHDKCPVSVSLIARHGGDRFLLDTVQTMYASLQEQVEIYAKSKLSCNTDRQENSAEVAKEKVDDPFLMCFTCQSCKKYPEEVIWIGFGCT